MERKQQVLIVDDEQHILQMLDINVRSHGYISICADSGEQALKLVHERLPDVILLDVMMPGMDGIEVCRRLKNDPQTRRIPVIMVSARSEETDRIAGLQGGADDYVTKPFNLQELFLRIQAALRQVELLTLANGGRIRCGSLELDTQKYQVTNGTERIDFTLTEFRILHLLLKNRPQPVGRETLASEIYEKSASEVGRSIDVHVRNIRKKLETSHVSGCSIETLRAVGFFIPSAG
jgi:DNA-binding response OmpR family regulator